MKALVLGIDSTVGRALDATLTARGDHVVGTTRRREHVEDRVLYLDLADSKFDERILPEADVAFFCAAVTRFADCRAQPELARQVNVITPVEIAKKLVARGTRAVLLSTSAVFDCREPRMRADRPRYGASAYGRLKAEAEVAFLQLGSLAAILRLTKVLTPDMGLFESWIEDLSRGKPIRAFSDLRFCPLTLEEVVQALVSIADDPDGGVFQVSGASDVSYADAANYIAERLGAPPRLVEACPAAEHGIPAEEVAAYTSLDTTRLAALCGFVPPDTWTVIGTVVDAMVTASRRVGRSSSKSAL